MTVTKVETLVPIVRCRELAEANIIKGALESAGIQAILKDEQIVAANPMYSDVIGGVAVQVGESDVPRAREILRDARQEQRARSARTPGGPQFETRPLRWWHRLAAVAGVILFSVLVLPVVFIGALLLGRRRRS